MIRSFLAATAALSLSTAVQAQTAAPAQVQPAEVALLPGAQLSPDCGGLNNLTGRAW